MLSQVLKFKKYTFYMNLIAQWRTQPKMLCTVFSTLNQVLFTILFPWKKIPLYFGIVIM